MLVKGDITKDHDVQAIVNAANCSLLGGGGVDGAIHRAAGPELLAECRTLYGCETGQAKITKAYRLPCEYVIHTPGPIWKGGSHNERNLLASCYRSCLKLAVENHIRSLAFPSISTGVYAFPVEEAARIAIDTVKQFVKEYPSAFDVIKWVLYDNNTLTVYDKALSLSDAADIVHSPVFDAINRMLRNGGQ
ncbi:MAG: O-acetyl-ADP-ribose deacetylase [Clostridia bacterium]|nr:O-acetyl-ADP-ribose deacetylase [Clostridia bacterium]MBQ1412117.1 O-acetyl-ADP-ribose deacetylase [Clostridia bacterium]